MNNIKPLSNHIFRAFFRACFAVRVVCFLLATVICGGSVYAQSRKPSTTYVSPKLEDLPRRPIDTIKTADPETKVIIYSNNTWEFYRPDMSRLSVFKTYRVNWDTTSVFSYRNVELHDLPDVVNLKLVDSLSEFSPPIVGNIFSKYGPRGRRNHNGVDIPLKVGEPILASFDGKVRYSKYNTGGFGNLVIVRHPNGLETWHAHLSKVNVKSGDYVKRGQVIGYGGSTGRSRGPHLHFEVRYQDQTFDPEFIFDFQRGELRNKEFALERRFFNIRSRASEILEEDDDLLPGSGTDLLADTEHNSVAKAIAPPKPASTAPKTGTIYHTIKSGDMLGRLAIKYGVTVDQICRLNNIQRTTTLALGRKLRIK